MVANGILSLPGERFYVYELTCAITGYYYIGKTNDLDKRVVTHIQSIKYGMVNGIYCKPYYKILGEALQEPFSKIKGGPIVATQRLQKFLLQNISIRLVAVVDRDDYACFLEDHHIKQNLHNPKCCNVQSRR